MDEIPSRSTTSIEHAHPRDNSSLQELIERDPAVPFGRRVAELVAARVGTRTTNQWAGAIYDIEDEELLETIRSERARQLASLSV